MQLVEPEKYPHLYKCLYGLLMLLPQSSAFAALKNRLNSVSAIGYLHLAPRTYVSSSGFNHLRQKSSEAGHISSQQSQPSGFERPTRLKTTREETGVKWVELLEKFKSIQEKARRQRAAGLGEDLGVSTMLEKEKPALQELSLRGSNMRPGSAASITRPPQPPQPPPGHKPRSSLSNLGSRFAGGVAGRKLKK